MDQLTYETMLKLNLRDVELISLDLFEKEDEILFKAKQNRSLIEYYFTCTPSLPLYILNNYIELTHITYLDADLYFYSNPAVLYQEMGEASVAIIEHRFPEGERYREKYGIYNVGYITFRRDQNAFDCLQWWREQCIVWCYDRAENGCFADQKYLDDWIQRFENVFVLKHKGANLAPWNLAQYKISLNNSILCVDDVQLIFYHFHGFKQINSFLYDPNLWNYNVSVSDIVRREIYNPYITSLKQANKLLSSLNNKVALKANLRYIESPTSLLDSVYNNFKNYIRILINIILKRYILYFELYKKQNI